MITFVTCWYQLKSKFNHQQYEKWMRNLLTNVVKFNLVIYSNEKSVSIFKDMIKDNPKIKVILKPLTQLYNYKYKNAWIKNHTKNDLLKNRIDWELNMLWAEKIYFVYETMNKKYFDTNYYGWMDIGYFRGRDKDIDCGAIPHWPNYQKISKLHPDKIYYALIQRDMKYMRYLHNIINEKRENIFLPRNPIPNNQLSIAGGFFISHKKNIAWWQRTFDEKLKLYFKHDYLIKDDQIIIIDCIMSILTNPRFSLVNENNPKLDNWFLFQRFLL